MRESIEIRNFGPVGDVKIETVKPLTILIGDSGSGKSTIMKVLALFQWIYKMSCIRSYLHYSGISKSPFRFRFDSYLKNNGLDDFLKSQTEIVYKNGNYTIVCQGSKLKMLSKYVPKEELSLEKIAFISDQRSIISDLLQDGTHTTSNFYLADTFRNYKQATDVIKTFDIDYLGVQLQVKKTSQGIKHKILSMTSDENDDYDIELSHSSSGTKNVIPLNLIVEYFSKHYDLVGSLNQSILSYVSQSDNLKEFKAATNVGEFPSKRVSLFVEEPELSLFPTGQLSLMDFLVNRCFVQSGSVYNLTLMLATHSPYIANYLNVLIRRPETNPAHIDGNNVAVYRVFEGKLQNLVQYNEINGKISVNTYDLAEPMSEMLEEYRAL